MSAYGKAAHRPTMAWGRGRLRGRVRVRVRDRVRVRVRSDRVARARRAAPRAVVDKLIRARAHLVQLDARALARVVSCDVARRQHAGDLGHPSAG